MRSPGSCRRTAGPTWRTRDEGRRSPAAGGGIVLRSPGGPGVGRARWGGGVRRELQAGRGAGAAAREPTVLIMGGARAGGPIGRGLAVAGTFGGDDDHADVLTVALDAYPDHDRALPQTLAGLLGRLAAARVAAADAPAPAHPLV